jgi:uncharacterized protein
MRPKAGNTRSTSGGTWYRQPMVWMIIAFPLAAVLGGVVTLVLAIRSDDGLVADDYYRRGKEIHRLFARDDAARHYRVSGEVRLGDDALMLLLRRGDLIKWPDGMSLKFLHATRAGYDRTVELSSRGDGQYFAPFVSLAPGLWHVQLEGDDWRLLGSTVVPGQARIVLSPARR